MVRPQQRNLRDVKSLDSSPTDSERDLEVGLPWGTRCWVQDLGRSPCVADTMPISRPTPGVAEATCIQPQMLEVKLPQDSKPNNMAITEGPHGLVKVVVPSDFKPGGKVQLRLGAPPEMRVQVPRDGKPDDALQIIRVDRVKISVRVPQGLKGGELFNVAAPVLVVAVPEGVETDELVIFRDTSHVGKDGGKGRWLQARCPKELLYGRYFAAAMPLPGRKRE